MVRGQHQGGRSRVPAALVGVVAVAAVATAWFVSRDSTTSAGGTTAAAHATAPPLPSAAATPAAPRPAPAVPVALRACVNRVKAAEATLVAAQPGIADWSAHVQVYEAVLSGQMPVAGADPVWTRTEQAGPADAARWTAAWTTYTATSGACNGVVAQSGPGRGVAAQACAARAVVADAVAADARTLMLGWAAHLEQTGQRRSGALSNAQANAMFRDAAHQVPGATAALQRDREALSRAPVCSV